jgi:hypothetical protein
MNIQQRLTALERQTQGQAPAGTPLKPKDWTDGEYLAVVNGLGLKGANLLAISEPFIDKYKSYIDKIRADYNANGTIPTKPLIQAKPLEYLEIAKYFRAKYDL